MTQPIFRYPDFQNNPSKFAQEDAQNSPKQELFSQNTLTKSNIVAQVALADHQKNFQQGTLILSQNQDSHLYSFSPHPGFLAYFPDSNSIPAKSTDSPIPLPSITDKSADNRHHQPPSLINLYPNDCHPKVSCKKKLTSAEETQIKKILDLKIHIPLNSNHSMQTLPSTLGSVTIINFIKEFQKNLYNPLNSKDSLVQDIRLVGSSANCVVLMSPSENEIRDIDIVFYLKYTPLSEEEIRAFLDSIATIFIHTLSTFCNATEIPDNENLLMLIHNHYLNNKKIVLEADNQWLIIGFGILDIRISIKSKREFTSSIYSNQISLFDMNHYCLHGDFEEVRKHLKEKELVLVNPLEIPNGLSRVIYELTRHEKFNIQDICLLCEKFLENNNIDGFINLLSFHIFRRPQDIKKIQVFSIILKAVCLSKKIQNKDQILEKSIALFHENLCGTSKKSYEDALNEIILKLISLKLYSTAFELIKIFCSENPQIALKSYRSFLLEIASLPTENNLYFYELLNFEVLSSKEDLEAFYLELFSKLKKINNYPYIYHLAKKSLEHQLFQKKHHFYFFIIKTLSCCDDIKVIEQAIDLLNKTKKYYSQSTLLKIYLFLIEAKIKPGIVAVDLINEAAKNTDFFKQPKIILKILNLIYSQKEDKDLFQFGISLLQKLRESEIFYNLSQFDFCIVENYYSHILSASDSLELCTMILQDINHHQLLKNNNLLKSKALKMLEKNLAVISSTNVDNVYDFINNLIDSNYFSNISKTNQDNLQKIIFPLILILASNCTQEISPEKRYEMILKISKLLSFAKKQNVFSSSLYEQTILELLTIWSNSNFDDLKELAVNYCITDIKSIKGRPFEEIQKIVIALSRIFNSSDSLELFSHFKKLQNCIISSLDKKDASMIYLSFIKMLYSLKKSHKKTLFNQEFLNLLNYAKKEEMINEKPWEEFINHYIFSYEPSQDFELFEKEFALFNDIIEDPSINIDQESVLVFYKKSYEKFLRIFLNKEDPTSLKKALAIVHINPIFKKQFLLVTLNALQKLSKKENSSKMILSIIKQTLAGFDKELIIKNQMICQSILENLKISDYDSFIEFLEITELLTENNESISLPTSPIEFLRKKFNSASFSDELKQEALILFNILQSSKYWENKSNAAQKFQLYVDLVKIFSLSPLKAPVLAQLLKANRIKSISILGSNKSNPWINFNVATYAAFHEVLLSWLGLTQNLAQLKEVNSFYDYLRNHNLNRHENLSQKSQIFSKTFEILMAEYQKEKLNPTAEKLRVLLLAEAFICWFRIFQNINLKNVKPESVDALSRIITYNLWIHFNQERSKSIEDFYQIIDDLGFTRYLEDFLKKSCHLDYLEIIADEKGTLRPPQIIIQTFMQHKFPGIVKEYKYYSTLWSD